MPGFVAAMAILVALGVALYVDASREARAQLRFEIAVAEAEHAIQSRIETYIAMLRAGTGLFAAAGGVTPEQFRAYVDRLELPRTYPGIQGIGFTLRVGLEAREATEAAMRRAGIDDFRIWPEDPRPEYHSIVYLEPLDRRNRAAIGYDMFTDPVRRAAMVRARDTGVPAASGKVTLVQEIDQRKQAGFLIYVPVFEGGTPPATVAARQRALHGYVYSAFRADDLLGGIFKGERARLLDIEVFDGGPGPEHLLHRSGTLLHGDSGRAERTHASTIEVAGRPWAIVYTARPELDAPSRAEYPPFIVLAGLLIAGLLFTVTRAQGLARLAAERMAGELRQSEEALRASESRLRRLFEANVIGIAIGEASGRVIEANDAFLALIGAPRDDMAAGRVNWLTLTPREYHPLDARAMAELRRTGSHVPFEKEYVRPDGSRVPVLVGMTFLGGAQELTVKVVVDIAERKRVEAEREQLLARAHAARAEAEAANRLKDQFLATISHELRTPLSAILGWSRLLRQGRLDDGARARALETIERNAVAQTQLVNDLLDVSSVAAGKLKLRMRLVDLAAIVLATVESARPGADVKGVVVVTDCPRDLPAVLGDPVRLQQVIANLLSNAVKFTPSRGGVTVRLVREGEEARLTVADTGEGIAAEFLPHVFDPFRQSDSTVTRAHGGLGLGLALVRYLVELHGGHVEASSDGPGRGATFVVALPLARDGGRQPGVAPEDSVALPRLDGVRALVVDNERDTLELVTMVLSERGADVRGVTSAAAAIDVLGAWRPHVLVSDISMPVEDGYSFLRRVRRLPTERGGRVPALALTAFARLEDQHAAVVAGFDLHLAKPVDLAEVVRAVARLAASAAMR